MTTNDQPNETYDLGNVVVATAALFYATSATMFLAATQTWTVHLARQSFLEASQTAVLIGLFLTVIEAALIAIRLFAPGGKASVVIDGVTFVAVGAGTIFGLASLYVDLRPLEVCTSGEAVVCLPAPNAP
jgi:hypothetical protein